MSVDHRAATTTPRASVELLSRDFLEIVNLFLGEIEFRQQGLSARGAPLHSAGVQRRAAGYDRLVEQSFRRRHGHQGANLFAPPGIPPDRDAVGVAAEAFDIVADPL